MVCDEHQWVYDDKNGAYCEVCDEPFMKGWQDVDGGKSYNREFGTIVLVVSWGDVDECWFWEAWCTDCSNRMAFDAEPYLSPTKAASAAEKWYFHTAHLEH